MSDDIRNETLSSEDTGYHDGYRCAKAGKACYCSREYAENFLDDTTPRNVQSFQDGWWQGWHDYHSNKG